MHVPDDIERNGPPSGTHSGPTEHNHIAFVKNNYQNTQKIKLELDKQLGNRLSEGYIIDFAYAMINESQNEAAKEDQTFTGFPTRTGKFDLTYGEMLDGTDYILSKNKTADAQSEEFLQFLVTHLWLEDNGSKETRTLYTEYVRDGVIFRAHPNYRSKGPWHDWVTCQYEKCPGFSFQNKTKAKLSRIGFGMEDEDYENFYYVPGQILGFFISEHEDFLGQTMAIINFLDEKSLNKKSVLVTEWKNGTRNKPDIIPVDSFVRHSLIIPKDDKKEYFLEILPSDLWADQFH